jgi:hypothetical protein
MNAKKLAISLGVAAGLFVLVMIAVYFYRLGMKNNSSQTAKPEPAVVTDKDKIPSLVTGTIALVDPDKLTIKQFANFDLEYQLNKADVGSVVTVGKNPQYDAQKATDKQKEVQDLLTKAGVDPSKMVDPASPPKLDDATQKQLDEINKSMQADPTLQNMGEINIGWEGIKTGSQVNLATDADGKIKLTVYPADMNIGPPAQQ